MVSLGCEEIELPLCVRYDRSALLRDAIIKVVVLEVLRLIGVQIIDQVDGIVLGTDADIDGVVGVATPLVLRQFLIPSKHQVTVWERDVPPLFVPNFLA